MQNRATLRNSLGMNCKPAALPLSYAGTAHTKAAFSELINGLDLFMAQNEERICETMNLCVRALGGVYGPREFCRLS